MGYNVDYEICSVIFLLVLIVLSLSRRRLSGFTSIVFRIYLVCILLNNVLDIVTCYTNFYYNTVPQLVNIIANGIFLSLQFVIPTVVSRYVVYCAGSKRLQTTRFLILSYLPAYVGVIMVIASYWTGWIYYFDDTGYHHGPFHSYLYINVFAYFFAATVYVLCYRKAFKRHRRMSVLLMMTVALIPTAIQFLMPSYMLSGMGTALSVLVMYFDVENLTSYEDSVTGGMNRIAFHIHIREHLHRRISEKVFMLGLDNFKIVNETYGMSFGDRLMRMLVNALQQEYGFENVFRIDGDRFAVVCPETIETVKVLDRLNRILSRKWRIRNAQVDLSACICLVHSGKHGEEDVIHAMDYALNRVKTIGKGQYMEVDDEIVEDMARQVEIEHALVAAVESGHFEVYYQPIYDVHAKRFHSMEALARLQVPGYGYVSPEEFILVAERNGTILRIGMLVLEEVCRFINEYDLKSKGIAFIEVNLSVVQCMQEKLYEEVMGVLHRHNIPPEMINLEVTESAEAYSEERLVRNMARLSLTDITFSLDDYGSGYSNVNYLVDLPFSLVKIDKYIVWAAMKKVSSRRVLEKTIAMFKDINLKVVTEGIEDTEMMEMVVSMGADYLQGYYFSKPVPKEKLVECLEEEYLEKKKD